jgi:hypothetical protein
MPVGELVAVARDLRGAERGQDLVPASLQLI